MKKTEILAITIICLTLTVSAANADIGPLSTSTSQASIDWTSLTVTGDITWLDKGSESHTRAEDDTAWDEDYDAASGWVDTDAFASITGSVYHAYGDAYTDADRLFEEVYAIVNETTTTWAYADAYAYRWGDFIANSSGSVTFSADYGLSQDLGSENPGNWTYGFAEAGLWLKKENTNDEVEDIAELENFNFWADGQVINYSDNGTLTITLWFEAGEIGLFDAWVYNEAVAAIPEPATICLLGLGVLSLVIKKKQQLKIK
ncbi:MAG: PEP-CTERM sorting domain-containing protein [Phycisphaerae bacterium]|nr:PEP-CTERM sorting domain-containing protein [Phycisphaerae bacterium]MDD5380667.1 PEP-CTERM sorting domain-containing protein [Phycisphaerae bacterium]